MAADKFLNTSGAGGGDLTNGSININAATLTADNLEPSKALKTNSVKQLISTNLEIADINNLQNELDNVLSNPFNGTLQATDLKSNSLKDLTETSSMNLTNTNIDLTAVNISINGNIDANNNKIINLLDPTLAQDASTKNYVDTEISNIPSDYLKLDGSTPMAGNIDANNNKIINLLDPTLAQDASTKNYVDTEISNVPSDFLKLDGSTPMAGNLDMGTFYEITDCNRITINNKLTLNQNEVVLGSGANSGGSSVNIGLNAHTGVSGSNNVNIGTRAGEQNTLSNICNVGFEAGQLPAVGAFSTNIGNLAGRAGGLQGTCIGFGSGSNGYGDSAVCIGFQAGETQSDDHSIIISSSGGLTGTTAPDDIILTTGTNVIKGSTLNGLEYNGSKLATETFVGDYLKRDGTNAMLNDLDMGYNNIVECNGITTADNQLIQFLTKTAGTDTNIKIGSNDNLANLSGGIRNIAVGAFGVLNGLQTGENNVVVGSGAQTTNIDGDNNTSVGVASGSGTNGSNNTTIGFSSGSKTGVSNGTAIGGNARANGDYGIALGFNSTSGPNDLTIGSINTPESITLIQTGRDNACDLGSTLRQFKDAYLAGTLNTAVLSSNNDTEIKIKNNVNLGGVQLTRQVTNDPTILTGSAIVNATYGFEFTPDVDITITAVKYPTDLMDPVVSRDYTIWTESTGIAIQTYSFSAADPIDGDYHVKTGLSVNLLKDVKYVVSVYNSTANAPSMLLDENAKTINAGLRDVKQRLLLGIGVNTMPTNVGFKNILSVPDFDFISTPQYDLTCRDVNIRDTTLRVDPISRNLEYVEDFVVYPVAGKEHEVVKKFLSNADFIMYEDDYIQINWIVTDLQPSYVLKILPSGVGPFATFTSVSCCAQVGGNNRTGNNFGQGVLATKGYFYGNVNTAQFDHADFGSTTRGSLCAERDINYPSYEIYIQTGALDGSAVSRVRRF
jgi:hypothetical protein